MRTVQTMMATLTVVAAVALGQAWGASPPRTDPAEQEVRRMIEQFRQALVRRDVAALERIWSDDYTFTNPMGRILTKQERLANFTSGATALASVDRVRDNQVRVYGNTAVVTNVAILTAQYSGRESTGEYRSLGVWVKRDGRWQLVANQITRVVPQTEEGSTAARPAASSR